jgi:hypothetical protein
MNARSAGLACALLMIGSAPAADRKLVVAIPPVDTASIDGADASTSVALAKLLRIEMVKDVRLQPVLLPAADSVDGAEGAAADAAAAARVHADVVLKGTILAADSDQSSKDVTSPGLFGGNLTVGGRLGRTTATVSLHLELVDPKSGDTIDSFDVESKISKTGVGTDLQTTLGSVDSDPSADKSPMADALRGAAAKVAAEMAKRAATLTPKS